MNTWIKNSALLIAGSLLAGTVIAQDPKDKVVKEKSKDIIIRKSGDKVEKTTIVIDGDNVTVNGKPMDEFKSDNLKVLKGSDLGDYFPRIAQAMPRGGFKMFEDQAFGFGGTRANRAMLGVTTSSADDGAKVTEITKESGAEKAGLKKDDVITKVGDRRIESPDDLVDAISNYKPNEKVNVTYKRDGKENSASITLGENKLKAATAYTFDNNSDWNSIAPKLGSGDFFSYSRKPKIGLQIQDLEEGTGVKIGEVEDNTPAAKAGLKEGDVITEVNGKLVDGVDNVRTEIKDLKEGDVVKVKYNRNGTSQTADIKIPKKIKTADL